jgi:hypothetical protein
MAGFREFVTGEVLTAANVNDFLMKQSVMVFADGAARDSALGTAIAGGNALVEGMLTYNKDTEAVEVYDGTSWTGVGGVSKEKRIEAFTGSGNWTVPAGVTYAIAHMLGGGGGVGHLLTGGDGANSSVAFAGGTVVGPGANKAVYNARTADAANAVAGKANTGMSAVMMYTTGAGREATGSTAHTNSYTVAGASVTPAETISVVVGAGGSAGTSGAVGGSGYVYIEYYEEV